MASRNVYVQQGREELFAEAAVMAGNLSAAVDAGLEMYVRSVRAGWLRTERLERPVGRGDQLRWQAFRGRLIDDLPLPPTTPGRTEGVEVFQGLSGRLAAWHWSDPDWSAVRALRTLEDAWETDDWFERWGVELLVFEDATSLADRYDLHEEDRAALLRRVQPHVVEELDL